MTEIWDCSWSVANFSVFPSAAAGDTELIYTDIAHERKSEKKKTGKKLNEAQKSTLYCKTTQESINLWFISFNHWVSDVNA